MHPYLFTMVVIDEISENDCSYSVALESDKTSDFQGQ